MAHKTTRRQLRSNKTKRSVAGIKVTFDTYGHLFPGRGKEASDRYEKAMREAREKSKADGSKMVAIQGEKKEGAMQPIENAWLRRVAMYWANR